MSIIDSDRNNVTKELVRRVGMKITGGIPDEPMQLRPPRRYLFAKQGIIWLIICVFVMLSYNVFIIATGIILAVVFYIWIRFLQIWKRYYKVWVNVVLTAVVFIIGIILQSVLVFLPMH